MHLDASNDAMGFWVWLSRLRLHVEWNSTTSLSAIQRPAFGPTLPAALAAIEPRGHQVVVITISALRKPLLEVAVDHPRRLGAVSPLMMVHARASLGPAVVSATSG